MALVDLTEDERAILLSLTTTPIQARTLAKRLGVAQSTLFRCLISLEDAHFIAVEADDDPLRRFITLTLTGVAKKAAL